MGIVDRLTAVMAFEYPHPQLIYHNDFRRIPGYMRFMVVMCLYLRLYLVGLFGEPILLLKKPHFVLLM